VKDVQELIASQIDSSVTSLGVSMNCPVKDGVILCSSLLGGATNVPLQQILERKFKLPVSVEDDIHAHTRAELVFGVAKQLNHFVLVNLGTGIGVCYVEGGVLRGHLNTAGLICLHELWVEELERYLMCDELLCGKGLSALYQELGGSTRQSAEEIFGRLKNDSIAQETVNVFSKYLARFFVQLSYFYNPATIVVTGSLKKSADLFLPDALEQYHHSVQDFSRVNEVVISELRFAACLGVFAADRHVDTVSLSEEKRRASGE